MSASLHEVIRLLVVDNRFSPEELEFALWTEWASVVDLSGPGDPAARCARWRKGSPFVFPLAPGMKRGIPAAWTAWLVKQSPIADVHLKVALAVGRFAMENLGTSAEAALSGVHYTVLYRTKSPAMKDHAGRPLHEDYWRDLACRKGVVLTGRTRVPALPPSQEPKRRGRPEVGAGPNDQGLLRYVPGYARWLSAIGIPPRPLTNVVRVILTALPSVEVLPTEKELQEVLHLRRGRVAKRSVSTAWQGFVQHCARLNVPLPMIEPPRLWQAPPEVTLATRSLFGSKLQAYRQAPRMRRQDVREGFPTHFVDGAFTRSRPLNRGERNALQAILDWNPRGADEDPLFPTSPDSRNATRARLMWQACVFAVPT